MSLALKRLNRSGDFLEMHFLGPFQVPSPFQKSHFFVCLFPVRSPDVQRNGLITY